MGIAPEDLSRVFEMFSQSDRPQERGHSGLGIGLNLVKRLVELHGGSVSARSAGRGHGTSVTLTLPMRDAPGQHAKTEVPASELPRTRPQRVMVVDDNEAMLEALKLVIELLGHEVRTASDGRRGLEVANEFRPDVIFMDLGMPHMSGYEAARLIRAQPWGEKTRLIALTGWGQPDHRQRTQAVGFDQHVVKPVRRSDLERLFAEA